jgi:hypothetical protein
MALRHGVELTNYDIITLSFRARKRFMETAEQITPQEWEATPASVRSLLQSLLPLAAQISALDARLRLLETERVQTSSFAPNPDSKKKVKRYQELVDRLFLKTITPEEEAEMQQLNAELEEETASFYAPIEARIKALAKTQETA